MNSINIIILKFHEIHFNNYELINGKGHYLINHIHSKLKTIYSIILYLRILFHTF